MLHRLANLLETPLGPALLHFAAELRAKTGSENPRAFFDQRTAQLAPMFDAAIKRGELPASVDREGLFTLAAGPVYFRIFIAGRDVDDDFIDVIVGMVCWQYCPPSVAAKLSLPGRIA